MIKFIVQILCVLFMSNTLFAQNESYNKPFNIKRKPGIMRFYTLYAPTENSAEKFDRFNTDFFYNSWIGDNNGVKTKFYSIGHNINVMYDIPFSKKSRFGIGIGLGYSHFAIRHNGTFNLNNSVITLVPDSVNTKWVNKTSMNFIEVPFEFRIRSRNERPKFKFYPGFKIGYLAGMNHKWRVDNKKYKEFNFLNRQPLHYGPTIRIGLNNVMIFGYYDLTMLFKNTNSSNLQLFSAGISIGWF